jgi:N-acetylneuraminate lyase
MINSKTEGFVAAPMTVYHPDGTMDLDIIPSYAAFLHYNGVVGVFINGTTGEGFSLTLEERKAAAEQWVKAGSGKFRVIVHVSHTCAASAGDMAQHAAQIGAGGIGEMGPIFYKPNTVEELTDCAAQTAAQAPDLAYYYYHMPSMSGIYFPMIDFLRAADPKIPVLAGIKYTHEDLVDFELCCEFNDGKYDILYGRDETLLCSLALGCRGAVGSTYNIMAPLYTRLIDAFDSGNFDEVRRLQRISMRVVRLLAETTSFNSALKEVMSMIGLNLGGVRSPLKNIDAVKIARLKNSLKELGFFDLCSKQPPA